MSGESGNFKNAVVSNDLSAVEDQLSRHPDLADARDDDGVSFVLLALYRGNADVAAHIARAKSSLDIFEASAVGNLAQVRALVDNDLELVHTFSADGFAPLHLAVFFGRIEVIRFLLAHGANVEDAARNASAVRPIHSASATRKAGVVRLILAAGADPDTKQAGGHTALHSAVLHNNLAMACALLSAGADPAVRNDDGKSAMELAESSGARSIVNVLRNVSNAYVASED